MNCWIHLLVEVSRLTIKASTSGSHRGQGHAAVKVERKRRRMEKMCKVRKAIMLFVNVESCAQPAMNPYPKLQRKLSSMACNSLSLFLAES